MWEDNFWNEMKRMRSIMNDIFSSTDFPRREIEIDPVNYRQAWSDFRETENEFLIALEIPGIKKEDIQIEVLDNNRLVIKAERKQEKEETNEMEEEDYNEQPGKKYRYRRVRSYAGFYKTVRLPENADFNKIEAEHKNGILKIVIPKKETAKTKKFIKVR